MRIGLDLDGVLYPWHYSIYRYFTEFKGYSGDIIDFWTNHRDEITDYYVSLPHLYLDTSPTQDVLTYVPKLAELGELFYITARNDDLKGVTQKFFKIYDLPFKENVIFSKNKAIYVRLNKIDFFLDDLPKHVDELKGITKAYLFKAVHNINQREGYNVICSIKEFYELLKEYE